jgi:hypothetical protein
MIATMTHRVVLAAEMSCQSAVALCSLFRPQTQQPKPLLSLMVSSSACVHFKDICVLQKNVFSFGNLHDLFLALV